MIMAGDVAVDGQKNTRSGDRISENSEIIVKNGPLWASRGAHKLLKGLEVFGVDPGGRICADIGASTGGFTDVLLSLGAKTVYAVDVGYGQLAWRLRQDPRVVVMERTNARNLETGDLKPPPDLVAIDVSFISLRLVIPAVEKVIEPGGECICLVKPQFEAGRSAVGKKGVIKNVDTHIGVLVSILDFLEKSSSMFFSGADFSPVLGPSGNIEFLLHLKTVQTGSLAPCREEQIRHLVNEAHSKLLGS
jgi:23S rRNA (cytidine1920-2'-O)/16S rRNA (cytidine1409-2'-O)-methyltransferase